uniref:Uncharacterized protein n=1 Tax=Cannabis sativa TaxID=3483 RepID=A0A803PPZ2_CANSA
MLKNGGKTLRAKEKEEAPFDSVKSLCHVQLDSHPSNLTLFPTFDRVENFLGHKDIVRNETTLEKCTLVRENERVYN